MYKVLFIITAVFVFCGVSLKAQELPEYYIKNASTFTLKIEGVEVAKGEIRIAVFNSEDTYTKEPVYAVVLPVNDNVLEWQVPDLPFGEYAIAVYHDKNKNGKLDTNLLGIPKENYGFSNNARGRFGPASWKDAMFIIQERASTHKIEIK